MHRMKVIKVLKNQTLVDIAMQELGDASGAITLAVMNGKKVTDFLDSGETIQVPDYDIEKRHLVNLFQDDSNKPASGDNLDIYGSKQGIGYWFIDNTFVVS